MGLQLLEREKVASAGRKDFVPDSPARNTWSNVSSSPRHAATLSVNSLLPG